MKKKLLIVISLVMVLTGSAQIRFGVEGGLNIASQILKPTPSAGNVFKSITSFNAGVFAGIPITKSLSLQPEIMYSGQGSNQPEEDGSTVEDHFYYLNVPVLLKYTSSIGVFAELGPQIGFVLTAKQHNLVNQFNSDIKPYFNTTDFSAVFGVGYISPFHVGIDFRYNAGFMNLIKDNIYHETLKNSVFQIGLFYSFSLKK